jgi:hypothetical protein
MDFPLWTSSSPLSLSKRSRDSSGYDHMEAHTELLRSPKMARVERDQREERNSDMANYFDVARNSANAEQHRQQDIGADDRLSGEHLNLTRKQRRLLQQWYEDFAQPDDVNLLSNKVIDALAIVVHAQQQLILEYIELNCKANDTAEDTTESERQGSTPSRYTDAIDHHTPSYSLVEANKHLEPPTLTLVEKYISACRRRRSPNDGRRSVNTGPYRCTFTCGYQTKRAFDWRRHEETHEPQELWLCNLCSTTSPFLVNRKDKFLKHIADKHAHGDVEHVLKESQVPFVPRDELGCRFCGARSGTWDERCRHILGHYEDEVERGLKQVRVEIEEDESEAMEKRKESVAREDGSVSNNSRSGCEDH